ncbi:MAG: FAD-dependent oxidoreductase, partial [Myxococcota bacterium]|nr:FAD-dependent oxidoreductase [Myxococcota bacterium]
MKVAIIGSGPAGAAAAYTLSKKGMDVVVFERDAAIGGRTKSLRKNGFILDTGAGFVTNFYPRLLELAKERGFQNEIEEMNRISGLFRDQRLASLNVGSMISFLQYPFLTWMEKAKMAFWMLGVTLKRKRYDIADPSTLIEVDQRSIADHARAVLTDNIYHSLVRPGIEPFWYFSCEDVSEGLFVGLSAHAAGAKFYTLNKGIDRICSALLREAKVRRKTLVESVSEEQGSFRVHFSRDGDNQSAVFDRVVFATTASVAARLSKGLSEEHVSSVQRSFLEEQRYAA